MSFLTPSALYVGHNGQWTSRNPSPRIWNRLATQAMNPDGSGAGYGSHEDFLGFGIGTVVASNVAYYQGDAGGYKAYEDTSQTVLPVETESGGVIKMTLAATDNVEIAMQLGMAAATTSAPYKVTSGAVKPLYYEVCFRPTAAASDFDSCALYAGLGSVNIPANSAIVDDTMAFAAGTGFLGFHTVDGTPRCTYKAASQTAATITLSSTALVTATWYQFGFYCEPTGQGPASQRVHLFWQGDEIATYITDTNIAAATFPTGVALSPVMGIKNGDATARSLEFDWFRVWQGR